MKPAPDPRQGRVLASPNRFKLATFGFNSRGGSTITKAAGVPDTDWDLQVRIARLSEAAAIEAVIPGARWKGYGGETDFHGRSYETLSWAAGLAALTDTAQVFATVHFNTIHPVRLAKTIATVDHIAKGRLGINWVAGWNADEAEMFGAALRTHEDRYAFAEDYLTLLNKLLSRSDVFSYHSPFFDLDGLYSEPKPIQQPRPLYMGAGLSPRGRQFAGACTDINFVASMAGPEGMRGVVAETKAGARAMGRDVKVFGQSSIFCAASEKEARDYFDYCVNEQGDLAAADNLMRLFGLTRDATGTERGSMPPAVLEKIRHNMVAAHGGSILVGTPTQVVEQMQALADAGLDGTTLSWIDFEAGLVQFKAEILPLMIQAGLRVDEPELLRGASA